MKICVNSMLCLMARPQIHLPNVKTCLDVVNTYDLFELVYRLLQKVCKGMLVKLVVLSEHASAVCGKQPIDYCFGV